MSSNSTTLKFFADYIEREIGIIYSEANYFQLEHRLNTIATRLGLPDLGALRERANAGIGHELRSLLLDLATNNETSFFRDNGIFQAFSQVMVPGVLAGSANRKIRIWSAAGSTGQEAYSLIMLLNQMLDQQTSSFEFELVVTDVSERVLNQSKTGLYSDLEVQRGLSVELRTKYFKEIGPGVWQVKDQYKKGMQFQIVNLLEPFPLNLGKFDIVFCRNVLIYQNVANKSEVIRKIHALLNPSGYFVLGAAESLLGLSDSFLQESHQNAVFYKKK